MEVVPALVDPALAVLLARLVSSPTLELSHAQLVHQGTLIYSPGQLPAINVQLVTLALSVGPAQVDPAPAVLLARLATFPLLVILA